MINMCRRQDLASVAGFSSNKVCVLIAMHGWQRSRNLAYSSLQLCQSCAMNDSSIFITSHLCKGPQQLQALALEPPT